VTTKPRAVQDAAMNAGDWSNGNVSKGWVPGGTELGNCCGQCDKLSVLRDRLRFNILPLV